MLKYKLISLVLGVLLITGCTLTQTKKEETKITATQGIGILEFKPVVTSMIPDAYNYILLSVRNNAEGNKAKKIKVSIENVDPFYIYENRDHNASDIRQYSNQFFDDFGLPYRSHGIKDMLPDEEIQFFWNIHSPLSSKIVDMSFTHKIYYTLEYDYTTTLTQTIAGISQQEYLEISKEGPVTLSGQGISSPGELKLESKTQQPLIYSEGQAQGLDFTLELSLSNVGGGIAKQGTNVTIALKTDPLVYVDPSKANTLGWYQYNQGIIGLELDSSASLSSNSSCPFAVSLTGEDVEYCNCLFTTPTPSNCSGVEVADKLKSYKSLLVKTQSLFKDFNERFDTLTDFTELTPSVKEELWLMSIPAEQLIGGRYTLTMPLNFNTRDILEPQKILTFNAYIGYTYLKEGSTSITVYPLE